ncbi:MAG: hypothetical protein JRN06_08645 [Nitrososphaerota archaeon]|nr:hypothetical protein [Nitrososphaerota archaeon]MDG7024620.1 hypothetical protein [Nitrososphaerota archaeon]
MSTAWYFLQLALQVRQSDVGDIQDLLSFGAGIFALILFLLSSYAWSRRRQPALLIVSAAFLLFFLKEVFQLLPQQTSASNLILGLIDFAVLAAFFLAIVVRPRRKDQGDEPAG